MKEIEILAIIRTILWFGYNNMPSDEEIRACYKDALERFKEVKE